MLNNYSKLATEVYDLDKPIGHSFGDIEYYRSRLLGCKGRILEVAVGTGRMLIPLLEAGFTVDGVDHSKEMLALCQAHCAQRGLEPLLYEQKMEELSLPHQYEVIMIPAGSFQLLEERENALQALDNFYHHLDVGGRLILDLFIPSDLTPHTRTTRHWTTAGNELLTLETNLIEVDLLRQKTVSFLRYEKWKEGKLLTTELQRLPIHWYGVEEFRLLLEKQGFSNITISSAYQYGKLPTQVDEIITFEASK